MGAFAEQLGAEQSKIGTVETSAKAEKEKAAELAATLEKNHAIFFGEVDSAKNALSEAENSLTDSNNLASVADLKDELKDYLVSVAATGNEALRQAQQNHPPEQAKLVKIDSLAVQVNAKSAELKNAVPFFRSVENALKIFKSQAKQSLAEIEQIKVDDHLNPQQKREQISQTADQAIEYLAQAKSSLPTVVPPDFAEYFANTVKPLNDALNDMATIKFFYASIDLCASTEYKQYLIFDSANGGSIKLTEAYKHLPPEKQQEIQMAIAALKVKIESQIEAKTCSQEHEKKFYSGKEMLLAGDKAAAKTALLAFYNTESKKTEHSPENTARLNECKELLKQIALFEIAEAEGRLNTIEADIRAQAADVTTGRPPVGLDKNLAYVFIDNMRQVIAMARDRISSGDALTMANVYQDLQDEAAKLSEGPLSVWKMGFQSQGNYNLIFDVLRSQLEIDNSSSDPQKRRQMLLKKAKEARTLGLFALAKQYYEKAFQPEIDAKRQMINREEFFQKMRSDAKIQDSIKQHVEAWENDFKLRFSEEYKKTNGREPTADEIKQAYDDNRVVLQEKLFNQMAENAYGKALRALVHRDMMAKIASGSSSPEAAAWNEAYGNTFVNVENFATGNWTDYFRSFWQFEDAEWNTKKWEYIVTAATTIAGGLIAGAAKATVGTALAKELAKKGLTAAATQAMRRGAGAYALLVIKELGVKRAAAYGITSLAVESGAFTLSDNILNGLIYNDWSTFKSPREFMEAWGRSAVFLGGCKLGSLGYSFRPTPTTAIGQAIDTIGRLASETAGMTSTTLAMMAMSGETITPEKVSKLLRDNLILTIGLHGAGKLLGESAETSEAALRETAERSAKMNELFLSRFIQNPAEIPSEMRGKPAYIGKDGRIMFAPNAFAEYGVTVTNENGANVFVVRTNNNSPYRGANIEVSPQEFLRVLAKERSGTPLTPQEQALLPTARAVRNRMAALKNHEVTHRVLETSNNASNGKVATALQNLFSENPALKQQLAQQFPNQNPAQLTFNEIQEYLSQIAEGRLTSLTTQQRQLIENTIATASGLNGFSFDRVRNIDTRMLANPALMRSQFTRESPAGAMLSPNTVATTVRQQNAPNAIKPDPILMEIRNVRAYDDYKLLKKTQPGIAQNPDEMRVRLGSDIYDRAVMYELAMGRRAKTEQALANFSAARETMLNALDRTMAGLSPSQKAKLEKARDTYFAALERGDYRALEAFEEYKDIAEHPELFPLIEMFHKSRVHLKVLDRLGKIDFSRQGHAMLYELILSNSERMTEAKFDLIEKGLVNYDIEDITAIILNDHPRLLSMLARDSQGILDDYKDMIIHSPSTFETLFTPESLIFLERNMGDPNLTKNLMERILGGSPDTMIGTDGKEYKYYPAGIGNASDAPLGEGGIGIFSRVALIDPVTGKIRMAGVKMLRAEAVAAGHTLESEAHGAIAIMDVIRAEKSRGNPEAGSLFIQPLAISKDHTMIFYEIAEYTTDNQERKTQNLEDIMYDPQAPAELIARMVYDNARALAILHKYGFIHGDEKSSQVFRTDTGGRMGDFGTVTSFRLYRDGLRYNYGMINNSSIGINAPVYLGTSPQILTPYYSSGEVYDNIIKYGSAYAWKADAYALGCTIEEFLKGKIMMPAARQNSTGAWERAPNQYVASPAIPAHPLPNHADNVKLLEIAWKLKDPNNSNYTVADAVREMTPIINKL